MFKKYMERKFSKRDSKEFNLWRKIFQKIVTNWTFGAYIRFRYKVEVFGKENLSKEKKYIIAANHVSGFDPFILVFALDMPIAFMAKEQLFEHFWSRVLMDWCGAFAVNREKLEVSTIKTALAVKNSKWKLGIFPQGTRDKSSTIKNISRGFVALAKAFGADGVRVTALSDFVTALDSVVKKPFIIECMIDKDEPVLPMLKPNGSTEDILTSI